MLLAALVLAVVSGENLVGWQSAAADGGWARWSPRPALAPAFTANEAHLELSGRGLATVFGGWRRETPVSGGQSYRLHAEISAQGLESLQRSVICQVRWKGGRVAEDVAPEYVATALGTTGRPVCDGTLVAPAGAVKAEISLLLQWAADARVGFAAVAFTAQAPTPSRVARIATLYWRPTGPSTPAANVKAFAALIDRAAVQKPDIFVLPEALTSIGTGLDVVGAAQEAQGPAFRALAAKAREQRAYVLYGAYEKQGETVYNSAFVIGRDGRLVGTYRKVQVPVGEVEAGLSAGDAYQPLDLDFGRVGILICHDTAFDEPARVLTLAGAEILFAPGWGGDLTQIRARALDNGVWVVTSGYDVPSAVIDPAGAIRARTWKNEGDGSAVHAIDLSKPVLRPWVGNWHAAVLKQRRPETYRGISE
jgi:predicted amidohydrolase